ncbi:MAG: hypothetical protein WBG50_16080 [Desulfomonilaceae bacterium]
MIQALHVHVSHRGAALTASLVSIILAVCFILAGSQASLAKEARGKGKADKKDRGELSWEMPGRVSIYDLQLGPAVLKDNQWQFMGNNRTLNAGLYGERLSLMIRFSYSGSGSEVPLKFVIRLPGARQYEETVHLTSHKGTYNYHFTIHRPEDFVGSGSVYLYYGFSMVDVLDFTIVPGT